VRKVLALNFEGKSPLGKSRLIWDNNVKTDLKETGWDDED
jgi:hypothetical protein